jgi:hypothetical protein
VLAYMSFREPTPGSRPYGSVAHFTVGGKRGAVLQELMDSSSVARDAVPGLLAGYSLLADKDPGMVFLAQSLTRRRATGRL